MTTDIDIEAIGEDHFKVIQEFDGLTNSYVLDQMNVNRHKDRIFAKKPKNWPVNKPFFNSMSDD